MNTKKISSIATVLASSLVMLSMMLPLSAMADNPVPTTTSLSPSSVLVGSAGFTLTVNGSNFVPGSVVNFNGAERSTFYVSSTQLTASIPSSDVTSIGTFNVTVTNSTPGGGTSNAQVFTVGNLMPTISSISPTSVPGGITSLNLTVNGSNFLPSSVVKFNGSSRATSYVSSTQLTAAINTADLVSPGVMSITVMNPAPGGGTSNTQTLTVTGNNPFPSLSSVSPASTTVGGSSFILTLNGSNFTPNSMVRFNGFPRATNYVSSTKLTALIPASDITMTGAYAVVVENPIPGGGTSSAIIFWVDPVSTTPGLPNTGFNGTIDPPQPAWSVAVMLGVILATIAIAIITRKAYKWQTR